MVKHYTNTPAYVIPYSVHSRSSSETILVQRSNQELPPTPPVEEEQETYETIEDPDYSHKYYSIDESQKSANDDQKESKRSTADGWVVVPSMFTL